MNRYFLLIASSVGFGLLFATASFLFSFGQWKQLVLLLLAGMGIGVLLTPIFNPENFKKPMPMQTIGGAFAGFFCVFALSQNAATACVGALVGSVVGATAPLWSKPIEMS